MSDDDPMKRAQRLARPPLPKRFYKQARTEQRTEGHLVLLDERPVRTPARRLLALPSGALAAAIAGEWGEQGERVDPATMPLTRLANTAVDGVADTMEAVSRDVARFAGSDLICYRADGPGGLVDRQRAAWDPLIDWAREDLRLPLEVTVGIVHVDQPEATLQRADALCRALDAFALTALHSMTVLTGSLIIALAVARGRLTVEEAWAAANVDEDWQISQWGEDAEAMRRRRHNWREMEAAARMYALAAA